jgi:hypothetical protein
MQLISSAWGPALKHEMHPAGKVRSVEASTTRNSFYVACDYLRTIRTEGRGNCRL